jgi:L-amino acid N-acyltransferase YncA
VTTSDVNIREAALADVPVLVKHRRWMFEEMALTQTVGYAPADVQAMETAYEAFVQANLGGTLRSWVVEVEGEVAASGSMLFYDWPPRPGDRTGRAVLLHSIYTAPEQRRKGLARHITETMVNECRSLGVRTVNLHASDAGRPLYELLGFKQTSEMRFVIRE